MYKHLSCAAFKIKLTSGSGNAGTCEKLHDRSRTPAKSRYVCASGLSPSGHWDRLFMTVQSQWDQNRPRGLSPWKPDYDDKEGWKRRRRRRTWVATTKTKTSTNTIKKINISDTLQIIFLKRFHQVTSDIPSPTQISILFWTLHTHQKGFAQTRSRSVV